MDMAPYVITMQSLLCWLPTSWAQPIASYLRTIITLKRLSKHGSREQRSKTRPFPLYPPRCPRSIVFKHTAVSVKCDCYRTHSWACDETKSQHVSRQVSQSVLKMLLRCRTMSGQWTVEITSVTWLVVNRSYSQSVPLILRRKSNTLRVCMSAWVLAIYHQLALWTCLPFSPGTS